MNLRKLSDDNLLRDTLSAVDLDRGSTLALLHHLAEIDRRNLHAELGFSSLFRYVVQGLKYSESAAMRRISAMQLLRDLPQIESKIASGALSLSTLARAQSFLRAEGIQTRKEKLTVLDALEGLSAREVERELFGRAAHPERLVIEKVRPVSDGWSEITLLVNNDVLVLIEQLRDEGSQSGQPARMGEIVGTCVREYSDRVAARNSRRKARSETSVAPPSLPTSAVGEGSRYIPQAVQDAVRRRDGNRCTYVHDASGRICGATVNLQLDHIVPFAVGGRHSVDNLRLRCAVHNQHEALKVYGRAKMAKHVPRWADPV